MCVCVGGGGVQGVHFAPVVFMGESGSGHVGGLKTGFRGAESVGDSPWPASHRAFGAKQLPTPVVQPGEFQGLYSPWGRKELNTTERLSLSY